MIGWNGDHRHNPEPYIEIRLKQDVPLMAPHNTSQNAIAYNIKESEKFTKGERPVDLYQVGSCGSCLSALRSRLVCAVEGEFSSKGPLEMGVVKSFQTGSHVNQKVPAPFAQSPLPIELFLHVHTWHSKYPTSGQHYALELNVNYAGVTGIAFKLSTLYQPRWNANIDWSDAIAQTDLLTMYDKRDTLKSTLWAMGLEVWSILRFLLFFHARQHRNTSRNLSSTNIKMRSQMHVLTTCSTALCLHRPANLAQFKLFTSQKHTQAA